MKDVQITEVECGKGKITVFKYTGPNDPVLELYKAINLYTNIGDVMVDQSIFMILIFREALN
jgi:hypothetical protein